MGAAPARTRAHHNGTMTFDIDGLLDLWARPHTSGPEAEADFGRFYTNPVVVNGASIGLSALVDRAIALQGTFQDVEREVLEVAESEDAVTVVFRISGRQVGPMASSAGIVPPTGRDISLRVIDLLRLTEGKVSSLWMNADELGSLAAVGAVSLTPPQA
jgi:predicted ester cyclase